MIDKTAQCDADNGTLRCSLESGHGMFHRSYRNHDRSRLLLAEWVVTDSRTSVTLSEKSSDETEREFSGIKSSKIPRYELIFKSALVSLATAHELGIVQKGDSGALNALNSREDVTINKDFVIERLAHCINHCIDAIQQVKNGIFTGEDAGAILFAGSVLAEHRRVVNADIHHVLPNVQSND